MSNYEANPVGFLFERYQSSGVSPLYQVVMTRGLAHAPIFTAKLSVPQGYSVEASGSSKKIAKNTAAKLMLDLLEEKEGQSKLVQNTKNKIINVTKNYVKETPLLNTHLGGDAGVNSKVISNTGLDTDSNTTKGSSEVSQKLSMGSSEVKEEVLNVRQDVVGGANREGSCAEPQLVRLEGAKPPHKEGGHGDGEGLGEGGRGGGLPVAEFYQAMRASDGDQITALRLSDPCSGGWEDDQCRRLALLGAEQLFSVTYREASGPHGEDKPGLCVVQLTGQAGAGLEAHTMCLGEANEPSQARQVAAFTALVYIYTMTRQEQEEFTMDPNQEELE